MSLKSSNRISSNECELEVSIPANEFNEEIGKVFKREVKNISIPGFRKGKAPRPLVEKYYGEEIFYEGAIKNLYPKALKEASNEAGVEIVDDNIKLDVISSNKEDGVVFKVKVAVMPEIKIGDYKGIEVEKISYEATDEDVNKEIEEIRLKNSRLVTVENRSAKVGDSVVIDFEGFIDGKPFEGGKSENFTLEIGKKQFIDGFEDQIVGHNMGDKFEINVKFPEDYHAKKYAGKDAIFKINLHEIKEHELPDLDDEFVKDISEFNTLDEYKKDLRKNIEENKKERADIERENKIVDKLTDLVEADIPEAMIRAKLKDIIQDFEYRLSAQGINLNDYSRFTGSTVDDINKNFRPQAETQVKLGMALRKISEIENIVPTEEDIEKEYKRIADHYKMKEDRAKLIVPIEDIKKDIQSQKAMEIVKNNLVEK